MKTSLLAILAFLALVTVSEVYAAAGDDISIKADSLSFHKETETYHASGNVIIRKQGLTLLADEALFNQAENSASAQGNVVLIQNEDQLRGESLEIDLDSETGEVQGADLFMKKGNFHLLSSNLQKTGKQDYLLERGTFTTCDGDSPSWKFTARELKITLEEYATGKHALFYIKGVPVLYIPYMVFPVKRERQSGFLMPRIGTSTKKGASLDIVYYWAISPSQDATFDLDLQSKRGVGTGVDYRYIRKRGSEGTFRGYSIYDTIERRFRGEVAQRHEEIISPKFNLKSDIRVVSDSDFFRDYGEASGDYNRQNLESSLSLTKHWEQSMLATEFKYVYELTEGADNDVTLQRLPTVSYTLLKTRLGTSPLFFSTDAVVDNFYREKGMRGVRADIHPVLALNGTLFDTVGLSVWGGYRGRAYYTEEGGPDSHHRDDLIPDLGARATTSISRVYSTGWAELQKIKHVVVPDVSYSYIPRRGQERLPFFDFHDRILPYNLITYGFTNYVTGKFVRGDEPVSYRDLLSLRISQGYQFSGERRDLLTLVDEGEQFTDIMIEARVNPLKQLSLSSDSRFNTYREEFSTGGVAVDVDDGRGNAAGLGYRFARSLDDFEGLEYLEGRLGINLVKPFVFHYNTRWSLDGNDFLESFYSLEYKHQCWSVIFSYQERPDNKSFLINFALAGIGSVLPLKAL